MVSGQRPRPSAYRRAGGVDPRQRSGRVRSQLRWSARPSDQRPPHRLPSPYATGPTPRPARARSPPPSRSQSAATHAPDPAPRRARIDLDARLGGGSLLDLEGAPRIGTTWTLRIPILRGQGHFPVHRRSPYEARLESARLGRGHGPPAQYACCETDSWTTKLRLSPCGANRPRRRPPGCGQVGSAPLSARANAALDHARNVVQTGNQMERRSTRQNWSM